MTAITEEELLLTFNEEQSTAYLKHRGTADLDEEMQKVLTKGLYELFITFMENNKAEEVTVEITFNSSMKGVSDTSPDILSISDELQAEIIIDQGSDLSLVVITAPNEEACREAQLRFWNAIAKHQKEIDCNYDAQLVDTWSNLSAEEQLNFQNDTNVRITKFDDENKWLLLSAFKEEHHSDALTKLKELTDNDQTSSNDETMSMVSADYKSFKDSNLTLNGESSEERKDGVCYTKDDQVKVKIVLDANVAGLLIGKKGATVNWLKDYFGVTANVAGNDEKTVVYLAAPDMASMILAQKDILKTLTPKQKVKECFYDESVCDAWEQISEQEQLELQFETNVNVKLVKNDSDAYLLLRAFKAEKLEMAKVKLYGFIVQRPDWFQPQKEEDDELTDQEDLDEELNGEPVTPVVAVPFKPETEEKSTDTSDLDITEWLRETLRSTEEALHGEQTVVNVSQILGEIPSLLETINQLKLKLENVSNNSNRRDTNITNSNRDVSLEARVNLFERIYSPVD